MARVRHWLVTMARMGSPRWTLASRTPPARNACGAAGCLRSDHRPSRDGVATLHGNAAGSVPLNPSAWTGTRMLPGSDLQATLQQRPEGASFCLVPGVYRLAAPSGQGRSAAGRAAWGHPQRSPCRHRMAAQRDRLERDRPAPRGSHGPRRVRRRLPRLPLCRGRVLRRPPALAGREPARCRSRPLLRGQRDPSQQHGRLLGVVGSRWREVGRSRPADGTGQQRPPQQGPRPVDPHQQHPRPLRT